MAGEDQLTATTHAAFAYTGSGYKKLKSADTDYGIRKQWVAGMREQVQDGGESGNKETQTQAHKHANTQHTITHMKYKGGEGEKRDKERKRARVLGHVTGLSETRRDDM